MMPQNYPTIPNQVNNTTANLMNPYPQPSPLVVAPANQLNMAAKNMQSNIIHNQEKLYHKQLTKQLELENQRLRDERINNELKEIKEAIKQPHANDGGAVNVNVVQTVGNTTEPKTDIVVVKDTSGRLKIPSGSYSLYLCLNIFLPGVGTMVAGCQYGNTSDIGDRTGELICHGVTQLLTCFLIFGWIWAIMEATKYFEKGVCGC